MNTFKATQQDRRNFLAMAGKGLGLATMSTALLSSMFDELKAKTVPISKLTEFEAASDGEYWSYIQNSFSVSRSIINLNNGGVCPSPRIVTEALIRYQWQQEEAPAHVMWRILMPQVETIRRGLADMFGCDPEEIAITRNASESLEILLMGMDLKTGDEILTTTQDYPRMITTLKQREIREGISLKTVKIPVPSENLDDIVHSIEKGITSKTRVILICHQVNLTGQIMPVKSICELAKAKGIEVIVDGAHSFSQFEFKQKDLNCDYFGTSLHKWLYAPKGTGMLYVKREKIEKIWPLMAADKAQKSDIRKFEEIGTHSAAVKLAIGDAITFTNEIGAKRKEARLRYLREYWMNKLANEKNVYFNTPVGKNTSCAIGNFGIIGYDQGAIGSYLFSQHQIMTTPIIHEEFQGIRITPNIYTTHKELDYFCNIVSNIAQGKSSLKPAK